MLILRSGITGFQPAPSVNENKFKQVCYTLLGSKVMEFIGEEPSKSFYECITNLSDKRIHLLLNSQYPFMAFTSTRELNMHSFPFIDQPELAALFEQYYKILLTDQLKEPLRYNQKGANIILINENNLHQDEFKQLAYWEPRTIGDVVFNYWD